MGRDRYFAPPRALGWALGMLVAALITAAVAADYQATSGTAHRPIIAATAAASAHTAALRPAPDLDALAQPGIALPLLAGVGLVATGGPGLVPPPPRRGHAGRGPPVASRI